MSQVAEAGLVVVGLVLRVRVVQVKQVTNRTLYRMLLVVGHLRRIVHAPHHADQYLLVVEAVAVAVAVAVAELVELVLVERHSSSSSGSLDI
jgi:hypothetical protein